MSTPSDDRADTGTPPRTNYLTADYRLRSWLFTTDHKRIALLYLLSVTLFFVVGGIFALLVRVELLTPQGDLMQAETYNKAFTMHGIIMVFFFLIPAVPAIFGNFLLPIMIGARDLAFPRINLLSWYCYMAGATFGVYVMFNSIEFSTIFANTAEFAHTDAGASAGGPKAVMNFLGYELNRSTALTVVCLLLFMGAMGKSAQFLLHTWLPDAMLGPTPVSALIHAATMVTAGVFMVVRLSPMFEFAPVALTFIVFIGASTAFFAATIGLTQWDIKRVIAYSTCSQLGYMFFAVGVGAYPAAIFHLMTHAFFKALLFLGSGSVIHGMHDEQDMRRMGGLFSKMKVTAVLMWVGSLSLAGVPLFAGFYSKDIILESAFAVHTGWGLYAFWAGIAAALMTALSTGATYGP